MISSRPIPCRQEANPHEPRTEEWQVLVLSRAEEIPEVVDVIVANAAEKGYSRKDLFAVRLALEEAVVNAVKHGNHYDPSKKVQVRYWLDEDRVFLEVKDEGQGFDPDSVPDPRAPANLERPCGRGLILIRNYMHWVRYHPPGNCVSMCRNRSTG